MEASFWDGKRAPGLTDNVDLTQYKSAIEAIEEAFITYADRPAFTSLGHTLSFRQIDEYSAAFAYYLQNHTSLIQGDAIAIQMLNTLQYPIAVYGALRAGLRIVNTNPLYTEPEMIHQFNDSGVKALLCMDVFAKSVENIQAETHLELILTTSLADMLPPLKRVLINATVKHIKKLVPKHHLPQAISFRQVVNQSLGKGFKPTHLSQPDDTIVLQYTGGTTGVAKSAELTNANIVANMLQSGTVTAQRNEQGQRLMGGDKQSIMVAPLPLYHIYSFTVHLMAFFKLGEHSILIANPRDTESFIKAIKPFKMTGLMGLNTLFVSLMETPRFTQLDFSEMAFTLSGGTALLGDTAERWKKITGVGISEAYGLTECSPAVCMNPFNGLERQGTVGIALPETSLKCIDAMGNEVPIGERGELCIKGPQVMKGYWNRPKATRDSFTDGDWLLTGDVAIIDKDGYVSIVDRVKDMIIVSGFNVFPNEIEGIIATHPDVLNCAAIGVPEPKQGEVIKLYVVTHNNVTLTSQDLKDFCKDKLTGYKIPRIYEFRNELPMSPVGKILKRKLKDEIELEKRSA
ncbi:AMP-binding protein [Shewanella sp. VB17]|uniref:AMP-binding protein n=1 Tax=Shewanella sp. VB17 TaxID=2739432 RepID=UPI0015671D89|nr:AMP-binding protein [Shewanella sp. VB17]NRD74565.1 AMP-binding protein [Shewanella sp. VB17]